MLGNPTEVWDSSYVITVNHTLQRKMGSFESAELKSDSPKHGASGEISSYQTRIPFSFLRTPPVTRRTLCTSREQALGRKLVSLPPPLFYYVTNHSPGEEMAPDELMHRKGWRDLKEILISVLTGRANGLRICQQRSCSVGEESSALARECAPLPGGHSAGSSRWPRPHLEGEGPGGFPARRARRPYRPVH